LKAVKQIKIRILKYKNFSVAAISLLEIWGHLSNILSTQTREQVLEKYNNFPLELFTEERKKDEIKELFKANPIFKNYENIITETILYKPQVEDIPDRFIDPISAEIMSNPVRTPSGKILDESTMLKHLSIRGTDPFTGLPMRYEQLYHDLKLKMEIEIYKSTIKENPLKLNINTTSVSEINNINKDKDNTLIPFSGQGRILNDIKPIIPTIISTTQNTITKIQKRDSNLILDLLTNDNEQPTPKKSKVIDLTDD